MSRKQGVQYMLDTAAVAATIGAVEGADDVVRSEDYLNDLIRVAHKQVASEFDTLIAAHAAASGTLNHMFEWGTQGINKGRTTRRMNPMSPEARLWTHTFVGSGKSGAVGFVFVPSKVPVPPPTTQRTGIAQKYLSELKGKHVFWNKAYVMETGTTVTIAPAPGKKLFIPHMGRAPAHTEPSALAKGFTMYPHSVEVTPGQNSAGTFTAYFQQFWENTGNDQMQAFVEKAFESDLQRVLAKAGRASSAMTLPNPAKVASQIKAASKKASTDMRSSAKTRRAAK